jgi:hypothetical protein
MEPLSAIHLVRDELSVFLSLLGLRRMNGLPTDGDDDLSEHERAIRYNSGEFTLHARGLLEHREDGTTVLDDQLVALVGSAAFPQATVMINEITPGGDSRYHFFSRGPELLVEHTRARPGVYAFRHWRDLDAVQGRVLVLTQTLNQYARQSSEAVYTMTSEAAASFLEGFAEGSVQRSAAALAAAGAPAVFAGELAASLLQSPYWLAVAGWGFQEKETPAHDTVAFFIGGDSCWLLESCPQAVGSLQMRSVTGAVCKERMLALLQALN